MVSITALSGPVMMGVAAAKSQNVGRISFNGSRTIPEIGFISSQLSGIKISTVDFLKPVPSAISAPFRPSLQPVARKFLNFSLYV